MALLHKWHKWHKWHKILIEAFLPLTSPSPQHTETHTRTHTLAYASANGVLVSSCPRLQLLYKFY